MEISRVFIVELGAWFLPLNFSEALGLSLFLSGCHFKAAFLF